MTLLKNVGLLLSSEEFPRAMRSEFMFRSCYISNYLTRRLRELRLTREYRSILVQGSLLVTEPGISEERNLIVPIEFVSDRYSALRAGEEHEFFIDMFVAGLERCEERHQAPVLELKASIGDFRSCGYRNEWTHQKKVLRPINAQASLQCVLDSEHFRLTLKLESMGETLFEKQILETKPDEVIFEHRYKEVVLEGDIVAVKDKFGKVLFSMPAASLN